MNDTTNPPIGSTIWTGTAFQCSTTSNQIRLSHSQFANNMAAGVCGSLRAIALEVQGHSFLSQLSVTATTELNGTTLSCFLSGVTEIGSDVLIVGGW